MCLDYPTAKILIKIFNVINHDVVHVLICVFHAYPLSSRPL